ncbi:hypothetical protein, partial [Cupriavidus sp. WS]
MVQALRSARGQLAKAAQLLRGRTAESPPRPGSSSLPAALAAFMPPASTLQQRPPARGASTPAS